MRFLIVGSGGREHALAWKLAQEGEVVCAPGNPGIAQVGECVSLSPSDHEAVAALGKAREVDLVVIGPEDPLVAGLADCLRAEGLAVFGPGAAGARLEGSKSFSKALMSETGVPTARFQSFTDSKSAKAFAREMALGGRGCVVKASGLALGKGVAVCSDLEEAEEAIEAMMVDRQFGEAGGEVVVEERLVGFEFSLLALCSGTQFCSLPVAQDYKRALDGDRGPNTGGMGSYSPVPRVSQSLIEETEDRTIRPVLATLSQRGIDYRGVLYAGMLVQDGLPYCLEFNVRFGDPEIQTIVRRLGAGLGDALLACARGEAIPQLEVLDNAAVSIVVASGGYPGSYEKGKAISFGTMPESVVPFHAGTSSSSGSLVTSGGRVLAVSAVGNTLAEARRAAYIGAEQVRFEGVYYRRDIAAI